MVGMNRIVLGNNLSILQSLKTASVELIYVDPPFNTGKRQSKIGRPTKKQRRELDGFLDE